MRCPSTYWREISNQAVTGWDRAGELAGLIDVQSTGLWDGPWSLVARTEEVAGNDECPFGISPFAFPNFAAALTALI
jgi:hypothetical protein